MSSPPSPGQPEPGSKPAGKPPAYTVKWDDSAARPGSLADAMTRQLAGKPARLLVSRRNGHVAGEKWIHDGDVPAGTAVTIEGFVNAGFQGILVHVRTADGIHLGNLSLQDLDTHFLIDGGKGHVMRELSR